MAQPEPAPTTCTDTPYHQLRRHSIVTSYQRQWITTGTSEATAPLRHHKRRRFTTGITIFVIYTPPPGLLYR
jgi:hypothetical protein